MSTMFGITSLLFTGVSLLGAAEYFYVQSGGNWVAVVPLLVLEVGRSGYIINYIITGKKKGASLYICIALILGTLNFIGYQGRQLTPDATRAIETKKEAVRLQGLLVKKYNIDIRILQEKIDANNLMISRGDTSVGRMTKLGQREKQLSRVVVAKKTVLSVPLTSTVSVDDFIETYGPEVQFVLAAGADRESSGVSAVHKKYPWLIMFLAISLSLVVEGGIISFFVYARDFRVEELEKKEKEAAAAVRVKPVAPTAGAPARKKAKKKKAEVPLGPISIKVQKKILEKFRASSNGKIHAGMFAKNIQPHMKALNAAWKEKAAIGVTNYCGQTRRKI